MWLVVLLILWPTICWSVCTTRISWLEKHWHFSKKCMMLVAYQMQLLLVPRFGLCGHSQMWEAAVAILLMDMEKTWCKPTKSTFHVLIDVHQWAGKCKQVEIWCPRSDLLVLNHPQPPYTCWWALLEMEVSQNSWDNVWLELERF